MNLKKEDIKVGLQVYMQPTGNLARYRAKTLIPGTVTKIGRKYFYVQDNTISWRKLKFDIDTLQNINEDCNGRYVLWPSQEEFRRVLLLNKKWEAINKTCSQYNKPSKMSDDTVNRIFELLVEEGLVNSIGERNLWSITPTES